MASKALFHTKEGNNDFMHCVSKADIYMSSQWLVSGSAFAHSLLPLVALFCSFRLWPSYCMIAPHWYSFGSEGVMASLDQPLFYRVALLSLIIFCAEPLLLSK